MKIPSSWLIKCLNALVQDFDEVAIVNICYLAKSSHNSAFGTNPNREKKVIRQQYEVRVVFFFYMQTHTQILLDSIKCSYSKLFFLPLYEMNTRRFQHLYLL